jgi:ABC-type lipoprotein release transport system permease subunit
MASEIAVALIGAGGSIVGVILGLPLINYRINQLEKKVEKHNGVMERTFKLETRMEYAEKKLEECYEREISKAD